MKAFTCNTFRGRWPVGTAAVVVAEDERLARFELSMELERAGLPPLRPAPGTRGASHADGFDVLVEVDMSCPGATILRDGDY